MGSCKGVDFPREGLLDHVDGLGQVADVVGGEGLGRGEGLVELLFVCGDEAVEGLDGVFGLFGEGGLAEDYGFLL